MFPKMSFYNFLLLLLVSKLSKGVFINCVKFGSCYNKPNYLCPVVGNDTSCELLCSERNSCSFTTFTCNYPTCEIDCNSIGSCNNITLYKKWFMNREHFYPKNTVHNVQ